MGFFDIVLEGDSLIMVKAIVSERSSWFCYGQIIEDIRTVLGFLKNWRMEHVKREANVATHRLAKVTIRNPIERIWLEEPPSCIFDIIILEQLALSL